MIPTCLLALPLLLLPAQDALTRDALETAVDESIHWLRGRQDRETGAYGGVSETAQVLQVLAASHRAYRPSDGPFVSRAVRSLLAHQRENGAITDGEDAHAIADTIYAVEALQALGGFPTELARSQAFLGDSERPFSCALPLPADRMETTVREFLKDLLARVAQDLAQRSANGSWDDETTRTCNNLRRVIAAAQLMKALEGKQEPRAAEALPSFGPADAAPTKKALVRGGAYLVSQALEPGRWGFQGHPDPGITGMVATALLSLPAPRDPEVERSIGAALDWLVSLQQQDGSIHAGQMANYVTSAAVMALARAGREPDRAVIQRAKSYLMLLQSDEGEGYESADRFYGGVGYGGDERPDLSNLQMALEALSEAGLAPGDETYQKALTFLQRCQNRSESNTLEVRDGDTLIVSGNDGGAGYAPGDSKAGYVELGDGRKIPRSYGSMTYALLKGYLFAGLPKDDPRVVAAFGWLSKNYTLDVNPGFEGASDPTAAYQGLFYYFTAMAKALDLYGEETIVDASGAAHAWRRELCGRVVAMQRQDGSWINQNSPRWYEGDPVLASAYAMITLGTALPE